MQVFDIAVCINKFGTLRFLGIDENSNPNQPIVICQLEFIQDSWIKCCGAIAIDTIFKLDEPINGSKTILNDGLHTSTLVIAQLPRPLRSSRGYARAKARQIACHIFHQLTDEQKIWERIFDKTGEYVIN